MAKVSFGIKNFFFSFVIVCVVIYIFKNYSNSVETIIAQKGTLEDTIQASGIIIKDETVYKASADGSLKYYPEDGIKVKEGALIANLNTSLNSVEINNQISEVEKAIEILKSNEVNSDVKIASTKDLKSFQNEIQDCILNKDLNSLYSIIGQENNGHINVLNQYDGYNLSELENLKNSLTNSINTNKIAYYSGHTGLVTYKIDGLEEIYNYKNVLNIKPSNTVKQNYTVIDMKTRKNVKSDDIIFKVISNFDYYITVNLNNEYAKLFEENKYIKTRIKTDGTEHEVWGYIEKINYGSESSVLIIYYDDYFYKIYDKRYIDLELITDTYEGLKIDTNALVEKDGLTGVYIQDVSNIIKFFPVKILGQNESTAIISVGEYVSENERRIIKISDKIYQTVKIFDKIVLMPDKVYEGQIVD